MSHFIQLHILTTYAAANLNRDDTGKPKTLKFGGAERLRISSQSLKRAYRTSDLFAGLLPDGLGKRSTAFADALVKALIARGLSEDEAITRAEAVIDNDRLGKVKKGKARTEQLVHLGPDELTLLNDLAERLAQAELPDLKGLTVLKHKPRAADIAMFGRMLADNSGYNVEAAVQVAHAFTTHRVTVEDDYYTAVDDFKNEDREQDRGAGFIGIHQFGAGLFYLYININADLLLSNLSGDRELAKATLRALIESAAKVSPTGKQNTFASRSRAGYILEEIGQEAPRSLAPAFQTPVGSQGENDYFSASIKRLEGLRDRFARAYGDDLESHTLNIEEENSKGLSDLIAAAQAVIDRI